MSVRVRDVGSATLIELEAAVDPAVNARAIALAAAIKAAHQPGVVDVVPTFRSVAVYFDPAARDRVSLESYLSAANRVTAAAAEEREVQIPVVYGGEHGPDLADVARHGGLTPEEAIRVHAGQPYRVYMLGFMPGFPYMAKVDGRLAMPRKATPRLRVAAGSVGIAGTQTGIYPRHSPGGWQIIGRTPLRLFDVARASPALLAPGDTVRFVAAAEREHDFARGDESATPLAEDAGAGDARRVVTVVSAGLLTTVQDRGRWGFQSIGVGVAGPMDRRSHDAANAAVGNEPHAAALEVTLAGPELRFEQAAWVAVSGADLGAVLDGTALAGGKARRAAAGSVLRFGERRSGARAYVAFDGGVAVARVLGSRSTSMAAGIGRALRAGDRLPLGAPPGGAARALDQTAPPAGTPRLRLAAGPQDDRFAGKAFAALCGTRFQVAPQSNRMAYRLSGQRLPVADTTEMISDATFTGAIQVTPAGEPILLMADRQTTGGYPQIATVIDADLPLAGQLAPGDWVEFVMVDSRGR